MRELIIGGEGRIGSALRRHLPDAAWTTRGLPLDKAAYYFDLLEYGELLDTDIVYVCAGVNGALTVAQNPQMAYRTNVDGTVYIAERYRDTGAFVVWISSTTVEWQNEGYGNQKRITEGLLRTMPHVGIVRAGRVLAENVDDLCRLMIRIGRERDRRLTLFAEDERPYAG